MNDSRTPAPTNPSNRPLDSFESALLGELKTVAAEQGSPAHSPRRRRTVWAASGAALATGLGVFGVATLMPTPAFSVSESNGELTVKVNRLEGAEALEKKLAEYGVAADITYLEPGMVCAEGRYVDVTPRETSLSVGSHSFEVHLPAGAVEKDQTFVLWAAVLPTENGTRASTEFGVADGLVAPCDAQVDPDWEGRE